MSEELAEIDFTVESVLQDELCSFDPTNAAQALSSFDEGLKDLLLRIADSPVIGEQKPATKVGDAAEAMGASVFRKAVLWRQLLKTLEEISPLLIQRGAIMAGLAVHELSDKKDAEKVADEITTGLSTIAGSASLMGHFRGSSFGEVFSHLQGEALTRAEAFFFGTNGTEENAVLARRWKLPTTTRNHVAPEAGSPLRTQQEGLALKSGDITSEHEAWPIIQQVAKMFGQDEVTPSTETPSVDASGLGVLHSLMGISGEKSAEMDAEAVAKIQTGLELAGDPRFIWALVKSALHTASRFHMPLSVIAISCGGDLGGEATVNGQVATFQAIRDLVRTGDAIGLLDAGHFLVVLPGTQHVGARILAERMSQRLKLAANDQDDVKACSPHHVFATSLNQEPDKRPTAQQLVQTALDGLAELKQSKDSKLAGWNPNKTSIFRP